MIVMNAPDGSVDLVPIAGLDRLSRVYLTRAEAESSNGGGTISLRVLDERRRRSEGRAVALSDDGEVYVRSTITRNGQRMTTTSADKIEHHS